MKVLIFVCCLALTRAGLIGDAYYPKTISTVYSSVDTPAITKTVATPIIAKTATPITYTKLYSAPAPVYESILTTHESKTKSLDGTQHNTFAKTLQTPYSSLKKFESRTSNEAVLTHSVPTYTASAISSPTYSQPQVYSVSTPVAYGVSPVTYTTHTHTAPVVTKTYSAPVVINSSPLVTKAITSGLSPYASHNPVVQTHPAVKITYSEAPLVSHMTFTGLGTSYSW